MNSDNIEDDYDDEAPTPEELEQIRGATPSDAAAVDALVLSRCGSHWQKVAKIVGASLDEYDAKFPHLPYIYMQVRMLELVESGALEAQGDVMSMRTSEVRLPRSQKHVA